MLFSSIFEDRDFFLLSFLLSNLNSVNLSEYKNGRQDSVEREKECVGSCSDCYSNTGCLHALFFYYYFAGNTLSFTFIEPRWPMLGNTHAE